MRHDDDFDDGLVHAHNWAKEPPRPGILLPEERSHHSTDDRSARSGLEPADD